ncbi:MAG: hypothetical protein ACRD12_12910 [Acidimicrobiales bacterium]
MVPTLLGRIQTRIFLLVVIGGLWTLVIGPFLPVSGATVGDKYETAFKVLGVVLLLGIGWELLYHFLMQFRWEKDWPAFFGFWTAIPEGLLAWFVVKDWLDVPGAAYVLQFATTWIVAWLFVNGPMRVPFLRWRFRGGRLV